MILLGEVCEVFRCVLLFGDYDGRRMMEGMMRNA